MPVTVVVDECCCCSGWISVDGGDYILYIGMGGFHYGMCVGMVVGIVVGCRLLRCDSWHYSRPCFVCVLSTPLPARTSQFCPNNSLVQFHTPLRDDVLICRRSPAAAFLLVNFVLPLGSIVRLPDRIGMQFRLHAVKFAE